MLCNRKWFEGERARGRWRVLARGWPGPGHRDRAVCSPGGISELTNHDHAGKVEPEVAQTIWIYLYFGNKSTFLTFANSFFSICNVQIFGETLTEAKTLFHTREVYFMKHYLPIDICVCWIVDKYVCFESRDKNSYETSNKVWRTRIFTSWYLQNAKTF